MSKSEEKKPKATPMSEELIRKLRENAAAYVQTSLDERTRQRSAKK